MAGDSRAYRSAEEAARELTSSIRREGAKLAERWAALRDRTDRWNVELDATTSVRAHSLTLFLFSLPSSLVSHQSMAKHKDCNPEAISNLVSNTNFPDQRKWLLIGPRRISYQSGAVFFMAEILQQYCSSSA